jgi:NAD(P)-dependent dehydrogenase (short-subunit alcohol dehydrogenase family)
LQKGRHGRAEAGRYLAGLAKEAGVRALVVGASGGIGGALVAALRARGEVVGLSRPGDGLEVTDEASVAATLGALDGPFDLIVVATGALVLDGQGPEKTLKAVTAEGLARAFAVNAIGPALVMKHALRLMPRDRLCRLAVLSARVGSIGDNHLGGWYGYRAAKAALNQLVRTAAVEASRTHPQSVLVALHPGTVETGLAPAQRAGHPSVPPEVAAGNLLTVLERLGPADTGGFFDWKGEVVPW